MPDRRRYSFYKGLFPGDVLNFSKRSHYVREIMLERVYPNRVILPMKMHYGVPAVPCVKEGDSVLAGQCVGAPACHHPARRQALSRAVGQRENQHQ